MTAAQRDIFCLPLFVILLISITSSAQTKLGLDVEGWANLLSHDELNEVNSLGSLTSQLIKADSLRAFGFLDSLETSNNAKGYNFRLFFCMVKADFLYARFAGYDKYKDRRSKELQPIKEEMKKLYREALDAAYHAENDKTIGWVSFYSAKRMRTFGETGYAVMYAKNGVDLFEKINYPVEPPVYTELADLLYQVREYDESIVYAKKGLAAWKTNNYEKGYKEAPQYKIKVLNTIGLAFYQKGRYDSSNVYFQQALELAKENNDTLLTGKVLGNIGRILFLQNQVDSAYSLFKTDYENNKADSIYDNAANASDWAARASLAMGNKARALKEAKEAIRLLDLWPNGPYLRDTYYSLTQIFRAMGNYDSAFFYDDLYTALNDSLDKEVVTSSLAISKARLNDQVSRFNIERLSREKQSQLLMRNFIIAFIFLASLIALLYVNRLRVRQKHRQQLALQEKHAAETMAREQLQLVTQNLLEKTGLAEELQRQLDSRTISAERQELATTITNLTILTEADWEKFKSLFGQLYPGFFMSLHEKVTDITDAELRMAALTRLRLSTGQIASILGISTNSVYKTKQRLRQRLNLPADTNVEELLAGI